MDGFPFAAEDWLRVQEAALASLNATLAEDDVLRASCREELRSILSELKDRYGSHPVLLETEADFSDDPQVRRELYQRALREAERGGMITYSIRISLARVLLECFDEPRRALVELLRCQPEVESHADESDRREWVELVVESRRLARDKSAPT